MCPNGQLPPINSQTNLQNNYLLTPPNNQSINPTTSSATTSASQNIQCQGGIGLQTGDGGNRFLDNFKGFYSAAEVIRKLR